jgi:glycosyltransferase involved in cell wall biosynthesis
MTAISIVIPTRGRPDLIGRSVRAVLANDHPDFDVVVVDQSDDDRTGQVVRAIAAEDARLRYVHTMPPGLSRAYNVGARLTAGPIIAFTDDDCVASPNWVASVARAFAAEPDAGMLYGTVALPAELSEHAGQVPVLPIGRAERLDSRNGFRIYGMGANFALRRTLLERIVGFDEILGGGGPLRSSQDFDFQYRAYLSGAVVLLRPEVSVDHYGLRTDEQWPATLRAYTIGDVSFYLKHVRCGDLLAAKRLAKGVSRVLVRQVLHLFGRRASQAPLLRAYVDGARDSLRYSIDRTTRLYRPRSAGRSIRRSAA